MTFSPEKYWWHLARDFPASVKLVGALFVPTGAISIVLIAPLISLSPQKDFLETLWIAACVTFWMWLLFTSMMAFMSPFSALMSWQEWRAKRQLEHDLAKSFAVSADKAMKP